MTTNSNQVHQLNSQGVDLNIFDVAGLSVQPNVLETLRNDPDVELVPFDWDDTDDDELVLDSEQEELVACDFEKVIGLCRVDDTTSQQDFLPVANQILNAIVAEEKGYDRIAAAATHSVFAQVDYDLDIEAEERKQLWRTLRDPENSYDLDWNIPREHLEEAKARIAPTAADLKKDLLNKIIPPDDQNELRPRILDGPLLNRSRNHHERIVEFKDRVREEIRAIVRRFHQRLQRGYELGFYTKLKGLGKPAQEADYRHTYVVAEGRFDAERGKTDWSTSVVTAKYNKLITDGKLYNFDALLGNPSLEIPPAYRRLLEETPKSLRPHIRGLFGNEQAVDEVISEHPLEEFSTESDPLVSATPRRRIELLSDPVVTYADTLTLFGWGRALGHAESHQQLVNQQRVWLDFRANLLGIAVALLSCAVFLSTFLIIAPPPNPIKVSGFTLAAGILNCLCWGGSVASFLSFFMERSAEAERTALEVERLKAKYPGFDATDPMLVRRGAKK